MTSDAITDPRRLAALRDSGLLDGPTEAELDRVTELAMQRLGVPVSMISLISEDRHVVKSAQGLPEPWNTAREAPLSHSMCKHVVAARRPLLVGDTVQDELLADSLAIRDLGIRAYAGVPLALDDGAILGAVCVVDAEPREWSEADLGVLTDLAEVAGAHVRRRCARLREARSDGLTGLVDAGRIAELAGEALRTCESGSVSVLAIGVDGIGLVNDAFGFEAGDRVLVEVAERLAAGFQDLALGRVDGDVFVAVCRHADGVEPVALAQRLRAAVAAAPFDVAGERHALSVRVAIASGDPADGTDGAALVAAASRSLEGARALGQLSLTATAEMLRGRASTRERIRDGVRGALAGGELDLRFEPVVRIPGGDVEGFEARLTWHSPELGRVPGALLVPVAEQTGDIVLIGEWALETGCRRLAAWQAARLAPRDARLTLAVSPVQLAHVRFPELVAETLERHGLPASSLVLSFPQAVLDGGRAVQLESLRLLREQGIGIALRGAGAGDAPLGRLTQLDIDEVRVDAALVAGCGVDSRSRALVRAVVHLAAAAGLPVVAPGVASAEQEDVLLEVGCTRAQGSLYGSALEAAAVPAWLEGR